MTINQLFVSPKRITSTKLLCLIIALMIVCCVVVQCKNKEKGREKDINKNQQQEQQQEEIEVQSEAEQKGKGKNKGKGKEGNQKHTQKQKQKKKQPIKKKPKPDHIQQGLKDHINKVLKSQKSHNYTFQLQKYETPQQFDYQISCQNPVLINFQLSDRLILLHKDIYLDVDFQTDQCINTYQDPNRVYVDNQSWDMVLENICCSGGNQTKLFDQTIKVIVKDGFKLFGIFPIKTKIWNIVMPILTSLSICVFVWLVDFSQPRAEDYNVLERIYHDERHKKHVKKGKVNKQTDAGKNANTSANTNDDKQVKKQAQQEGKQPTNSKKQSKQSKSQQPNTKKNS